METLFRLFGYETPSLAEPKLNELLYALQISVDDSPYMVAHQTRYTVPAAIDVLSTCQLTPLNTENITIDDVNKWLKFLSIWLSHGGFDTIPDADCHLLEEKALDASWAISAVRYDYSGDLKAMLLEYIKSKLNEMDKSSHFPCGLYLAKHLVDVADIPEYVCCIADQIEEAERVRSVNNFEPPNQKLMYAMARVKNSSQSRLSQPQQPSRRQLVIR